MDTIKEVYEKNYGTIYETYKSAVKKDSSIRFQDVKDYFKQREDKQTQFKYKGYNSFVSKGNLFEIEIDIMDLGVEYNPRYGFVGIDNFSKKGHCVPIQDKKPDEVVRGLKEILQKIGVPKQIYSDEEGSFNSLKFIRVINENKIKHIQTSTHANVAERFIKTLKDNIHRRPNPKEWNTFINEILNKYNNTKHNTINAKPNEATKEGNGLWVAWHLYNEASRNRKYPSLSVGSQVRVNIKPGKYGQMKAHSPKWSPLTYKVIAIRGNEYLLNHTTRRRIFLRHELLKV
jgi:hypothetical protein